MMISENDENEGFINTVMSVRLQTAELETNIEKDAEREASELTFNHRQNIKSLKRPNTLLSNEKDILQQRHITMQDDLQELQEQFYNHAMYNRCWGGGIFDLALFTHGLGYNTR